MDRRDDLEGYERQRDERALLPQPGFVEFTRLHRNHVGVEAAKRVADLVDDQRKLAAGAVAETDRERIEGVTEQARIAQQLYPPAAELCEAITT
jgi:hypothetical protein